MACSPPRVTGVEGAEADLGRWGGKYAIPPGTTWKTLSLSDEGFAFRVGGCLGVYVDATGTVQVEPDRLVLTGDDGVELSSADVIDARMVKVTWGERRYLVPERAMIEFCNTVNAGTEGSSFAAAYLLHEGDRERAVDGLPVVPPSFAAYLLREPVRAELQSVRSDPAGAGWSGTISAGTASGVRPGMRFHTPSGAAMRVTGARPNSADVESVDWSERGQAPPVRTEVSTHVDWAEFGGG